MRHHGEDLRHLTRDSGLFEQLTTDFRRAQISEPDCAMLEYAVKLTLEPWNVVQDDIQKLRKTGWRDADILDINQISGYFAFVNRLAEGLGVELEAFWKSSSPE